MESPANKFAELRRFADKHRSKIEAALREHLPPAPASIETEFKEALEKALYSEQMRVCPLLTLLGAELVGGRGEDVLPAAAAVEYVRIAADIFENILKTDLSESSKAETERAGLENFSERTTQLLAGIGFLNSAYSLVFINHADAPEAALAAHAEIVECVGAAGLVGGLSADFERGETFDRKANAQNNSAFSRKPKNAALMRLGLRAGAILAGAGYLELGQISRFARSFSESGSFSESSGGERETDENVKKNGAHEEAKLILVENFPSNKARSCLIQLTDYLASDDFRF